MIAAGFEFVIQIHLRIWIKIQIYVPFIYVVFQLFCTASVRNNAMNLEDLPAGRRVAWPVSIIDVKFEGMFSNLF